MATEFSTLSPLPGGNGHYVATLTASLQWVAQTSRPTRGQLAQWFVQRFRVRSRSTSNYIHVLTRLGMIQIDALDRVIVTPFGQQFLQLRPDEQIQLLVDFLLRHQRGMESLLAVYAAATEPLHIRQAAEQLRPQFPRWTHMTPFVHRSLWLLSLDCLKQVKGRYYQITGYGRTVILSYKLQSVKTSPSAAASSDAAALPIDSTKWALDLTTELAASAVDSQAPQRLQHAVSRAFVALGFQVEERGEPGNTDIIVRARIGPGSYTAIIDVKARQDGKLRDISGFTLDEHRRLHQADYALVVAGEFGNGKLMRQAEQHQITLLSVQLLCQWLELHDRTPLNLLAYRVVFEQKGQIKTFPETLLKMAAERDKWMQLLADVATVLEEAYNLGLSHAITSEQLFGMLVARSQSVRYAPKQIDELLAWLAHPLIDLVAISDNRGIVPTRSWSSFREVRQRLLPSDSARQDEA